MRKVVYCTVNGWDCPYYHEDGTCGMYPARDPREECDDFAFFWDEGDDYVAEVDE